MPPQNSAKCATSLRNTNNKACHGHASSRDGNPSTIFTSRTYRNQSVTHYSYSNFEGKNELLFFVDMIKANV